MTVVYSLLETAMLLRQFVSLCWFMLIRCTLSIVIFTGYGCMRIDNIRNYSKSPCLICEHGRTMQFRIIEIEFGPAVFAAPGNNMKVLVDASLNDVDTGSARELVKSAPPNRRVSGSSNHPNLAGALNRLAILGAIPRDRLVWILSNAPLMVGWNRGAVEQQTSSDAGIVVPDRIDDISNLHAKLRLIRQEDLTRDIDCISEVDDSWKNLDPIDGTIKVAEQIKLPEPNSISSVLESLGKRKPK